MSLRPRAGAPNPGRGGDGRRRRWSESPIPRVASRRVRMVGAVETPPVPAETFFTVTLEDPAGVFNEFAEVALGVWSPGDGLGENTTPTPTPLTFPATGDNTYFDLASLWALYGATPPPYTYGDADQIITDAGWGIITLPPGQPYIYRSSGLYITGVTMTVLGVDYEGTETYANINGGTGDWAVRLFTFDIPLPFTIAN